MGEAGGVFRRRESSSSDRFLSVFSQSQPADAADPGDLNEGDVFWTGDFAQNSRRCSNPPENSRSFLPTGNFGILAALPGNDGGSGHAVYHASSVSSRSSSRMIRKPPGPCGGGREVSESVTMELRHQSAPMKVPVLSRAVSKEGKGRSSVLMEVDGDEEGEEVEVMLPPHEMVAARSSDSDRSPFTTYSVLEGVGRTLKGRDLRQVRNAVWRRTGFLD